MAFATNRQKRIEQEERELEELIKQHSNQVEESTEESEEEEVPEESEEETETTTETEEQEEESLPEPDDDEEKTWKKRHGDLRRHTQRQINELKQELKEAKELLTEAKKDQWELPASKEELESWRKEHPKAAAIVESIAQEIADKKIQESYSSLEDIRKEQANTKKQKAENEIIRSHSDWDKIKDSDDFHDWLEEQPSWIQSALYENSTEAKPVIRVIDLYKSDKGLTEADKKKRKTSSASAVNTKSKTSVSSEGSKRKYKESEIEAMSPDEFYKKEADIAAAQREGRIIFDKTGGAR